MDKYITNEQFSEVFSKLKDEPLKITYEECFCKYKGYILPGNAMDCVKDMPTWEVRSDDVWNLSYPKTGSTWLQEIICAAMYNGDLRNMKKQHQEMRMMFLDFHPLPPEELIKLKARRLWLH
ncbi:sulfotransferase 1E1-like [Asterias rubens]|uniref:sulfotransferase 1E1-like n=1 Tax=Asterias rubens TaxID=7604 RepID=UPI00145532DA|nr:sulfotransferase 1E1-like [Asterias rubens]